MSEAEMEYKAMTLAIAGDEFSVAVLKLMEHRDKLITLAADLAERCGKQSELLALHAEKESS